MSDGNDVHPRHIYIYIEIYAAAAAALLDISPRRKLGKNRRGEGEII
jgi:hypothetical protein